MQGGNVKIAIFRTSRAFSECWVFFHCTWRIKTTTAARAISRIILFLDVTFRSVVLIARYYWKEDSGIVKL